MKSPATPPDFRADINGLRAWAVGAVILYHFGISGFGGGFVGVDIFFVISGFLMTSIIVAGLENKPIFSVWSFYSARARRIVPALVALCAALTVVGWWIMLPTDYKALGTHVIASLVFISNIKFWLEANYFDTASHEKWLLHTWSLAAEWQFYLLPPLLLMLVWKLAPGRRALIAVIGGGCAISLVAAISVTPFKPTSAFYLLPFRAWEMLAGGLVFLVGSRTSIPSGWRNATSHIGFALILGACAAFDSASSWPGWRALVPVTGAVLVVLAACPRSFWTRHPITQWLGTRSYSLYLWHWPCVVALVYADLKPSIPAVLLAMGTTIVLGHLSYRFIEVPARQYLVRQSVQMGALVLLLATFVVAIPAIAIRLNDGVSGRFPPDIEATSNESLNTNRRGDACNPSTGSSSPSCLVGGTTLRVILMGDSHAHAVVTALAAANHPGDGVMEWAYNGCPTIEGVHSKLAPQCGAFINWSIDKLNGVPADVPLVLVSRFAQYAFGRNEYAAEKNVPLAFFSTPYRATEPAFLEEFATRLTDTACRLSRGRTVFMMRPIPELGINVPGAMARAMVMGKSRDVSISLAEYQARNGFIWTAQNEARDRCGVKILDPIPYLCPDGHCHGAKDGRPLYYDNNHLSEWGNRMLIPMFAEVSGLARQTPPTRQP